MVYVQAFMMVNSQVHEGHVAYEEVTFMPDLVGSRVMVKILLDEKVTNKRHCNMAKSAAFIKQKEAQKTPVLL
jgi:hypothetical protein